MHCNCSLRLRDDSQCFFWQASADAARWGRGDSGSGGKRCKRKKGARPPRSYASHCDRRVVSSVSRLRANLLMELLRGSATGQSSPERVCNWVMLNRPGQNTGRPLEREKVERQGKQKSAEARKRTIFLIWKGNKMTHEEPGGGARWRSPVKNKGGPLFFVLLYMTRRACRFRS